MTTNKIQTYINTIDFLTLEGANPSAHVTVLTELRTFLAQLGSLVTGEITPAPQLMNPHMHSDASAMDVPGGAFAPTPTPEFEQILEGGPQAPFQVKAALTAPGAMKLSSMTEPVVDGCIAAQPKQIMEQAAQQRLTQLLQGEKKKKSLTESLMQQVQAAPAKPAEQDGNMTLAEFVASQSAAQAETPATPSLAPETKTGEMTLGQFVAASQTKASVVPESPATETNETPVPMTLAQFQAMNAMAETPEIQSGDAPLA